MSNTQSRTLHIVGPHSNYQQLLLSPCLLAPCSTELSLIHAVNGLTTWEADANHDKGTPDVPSMLSCHQQLAK